MTLYDKLREYNRSGIYPFCMPGHKQRLSVPGVDDPYQMDITEMEGFDDLHDPHGVIRNIMDLAAEVYKCANVYISVNGSTACNLAALYTVPEGGPVLIAANCHRSVFNGAKIARRNVIELAPEWLSSARIYGGIMPENVEKTFRGYPDIKALVITSPTYEGFVSDIETIAGIVHSHGALLIVDEAHGAHLPFGNQMPVSALRCGADIVIQSFHKTMGSLNQTAWMFVPNEEIAQKAWDALKMFTTTSPSYLLMASMEEALLRAVSKEGEQAFAIYEERLGGCRRHLAGLENIEFIDEKYKGRYAIMDIDPSKLVFASHKISGREMVLRMLNEHHIQLEKYGDHYAVAMTSFYDTEEGFERLLEAVWELDASLK